MESMGIISVLAAAIASYAFGAIWYMSLATPWMAAAGLTKEQVQGTPDGPKPSPMPYVISFVCAIIVAGMMRHVLVMSSVDGVYKSGLTGFGIGLFLASPWIATNYAFSLRPRKLTLIDTGYATIGCTIMGIVFGLF
jgi:hypothetical protein